MLQLPPAQKLYLPQTVTVHQVATETGPWRSSPNAEILLLGDSFSNIFSLAALGWGEAAGFAEHIARALGNQQLDCILRNSDAAFATREILSRELSRGRNRLRGKKIVVWQFAERELAFGDWKLMDMNLGQTGPAQFFVPKPGEQIEVSATIESISSVPKPGSVPYKDHIMAIHLVDVAPAGREAAPGLESLVYLWSMRDNVTTAAARLRADDHVTLRLRPWADVSADYEKINRSEVEDAAVQLEEPAWGELVP